MCFYLRNWQVTFLLYTLGVFISEYTAKAFTEPRDYRVVFLIQKTDLNLQIRFFRVIVSDDVCLIKRAQRVRTSDKMYKHTFFWNRLLF